MTRQRSVCMAAAAVLCLTLPRLGAAQDAGPSGSGQRKLSGPRFGVTILTREMRDSLAAYDIKVGPVITQFGWQWERQFAGSGSFTAVNEWILLVGGLEQGEFLPSLSWLVGLRSKGGTEFGVGPNLSAAGMGLVLAAGVTLTSGSLNIPFNVAVVPTNEGARVGFLAGFNSR